MNFGWVRDSLDHRDRSLTLAAPTAQVVLPPAVDLRGLYMAPVYDQKSLGSCTANAIAAAVDFERAKQEAGLMYPSRLFIYYNERVIEGTVESDSGAQIRNGIKVIASQGVPKESAWPYVEDQFAVKPTDSDYTDALLNKTLSYSRVTQSEYHVKHCLAVFFQPVIFGFTVFEAFESDEVAKTGTVAMPGPNDVPIGGHAVLCCGYSDSTKTFLVRNSWGGTWGDGGYFHMPYGYLLNPGLASDFWTLMLEQV